MTRPGTPRELSVSEHRQMTELVVMLRSLGDDPSAAGLCDQLRRMIDEHVERERREDATMPCLDELVEAAAGLCAGAQVEQVEQVAATLARHVEAQERHPDRQLGGPTPT